MYIFTMPRDRWDELNPDRTALMQLVLKHYSMRKRMKELKDYYEGRHKILADSERENKLVCNHAKDITDTATAYFLGNAIIYKAVDNEVDTRPLTDALSIAGADEADGDNALDASIYGHAYDYIYAGRDSTDLQIKNLEPASTFMVYDDTIEQNELFAVYYYIRRDDSDMSGRVHYIATVLTENYKWRYDLQEMPAEYSVLEGPVPHYMAEVPVTEWMNNKFGIGDWELQIPLIDAYNALMSDRVTDKEQFIEAILAVYGTLLSDDEESGDGDDSGTESKVMKRIKKTGYIEVPNGSKAEYLIRTFDEQGVEVLKKAIEEDIHKFSHIPCLTDDSFAGNVSGVAMEFKLLGIENITKIKTRYYRKALRKRIRIFCGWLALNRIAQIDPRTIEASFTRGLPKNLLEISQMVTNLQGLVSRRTLLSQIPFVIDPEEEMEAVDAENEQAVRRQQAMFAVGINAPPDGDDDDEPLDGGGLSDEE